MTTAAPNAWAYALDRLEAELAAEGQRAQLEEAEVVQRQQLDSLRSRYARWRVDPAAFATEAIEWPEGQGLAPYQIRTMRTLAKERRLVLRKLHGVGGTATAALVVLWFALTREFAGDDWKVVTTASAWRQLKEFLWPEIRKWTRRLRWDELGVMPWVEERELLDMAIKLDHGSAFAVASNDPAKLEGAHADQLLYLFDEAKTIPAGTFDAAEGAFSGAGDDTHQEAFAFALSTPGEPNGRFYDLCRRSPGTEEWTVQRITLDEGVKAGRVSAEWVEAKAALWGRESAQFKNRALGEFASADEDGVIPLSWVEAAVERWQERYGTDGSRWLPPAAPGVVGVDLADSGEDSNVIAHRYGWVVGPLERPAHRGDGVTGSIVAAAESRVAGLLTTYPEMLAVVDAVGMGATVVGTLRRDIDPDRVDAFVAGARTNRRDFTGEWGFADCRAAAWWGLRELLDPVNGEALCLPPDDLMISDLTAPHWREVSGGRIRVETKVEIAKRLGRSTDSGDAVVQAFWPRGPVVPVAPVEIEGSNYWAAGVDGSTLDEEWGSSSYEDFGMTMGGR